MMIPSSQKELFHIPTIPFGLFIEPSNSFVASTFNLELNLWEKKMEKDIGKMEK